MNEVNGVTKSPLCGYTRSDNPQVSCTLTAHEGTHHSFYGVHFEQEEGWGEPDERDSEPAVGEPDDSQPGLDAAEPDDASDVMAPDSLESLDAPDFQNIEGLLLRGGEPLDDRQRYHAARAICELRARAQKAESAVHEPPPDLCEGPLKESVLRIREGVNAREDVLRVLAAYESLADSASQIDELRTALKHSSEINFKILVERDEVLAQIAGATKLAADAKAQASAMVSAAQTAAVTRDNALMDREELLTRVEVAERGRRSMVAEVERLRDVLLDRATATSDVARSGFMQQSIRRLQVLRRMLIAAHRAHQETDRS